MNDSNSEPLWKTYDSLNEKIEHLNKWMAEQPWAHQFGIQVKDVGTLSLKRSTLSGCQNPPALHITKHAYLDRYDLPLTICDEHEKVVCLNCMAELVVKMKDEYAKRHPEVVMAIQNIDKMCGATVRDE